MSQADSTDPIHSDALRTLGHRLREARESKSLTAVQASVLSGVKATSILTYERGQAEPGTLKVIALAAAYGACCNWLLGQSDLPRGIGRGQAVADLDKLDAVRNAKTEADMDRIIMWNPPPIWAVVSLPMRQRIVDGQEAVGLGVYILDRLRSVAPETHKRWATQHLPGEPR